VIDTGRVKEMKVFAFNKLQTGILSLMEIWASLAACKQRRGRAGRVQPGISYKLYTTQYAKKYMHKYTEPGI
jgi:ATP-dependent RNA helicase DHX57